MSFAGKIRKKIALTVAVSMLAGILGGGVTEGRTGVVSAAEDTTTADAPEGGDAVASPDVPQESEETASSAPDVVDVLQVTGLEMTENTTTSVTLSWSGSLPVEGSYYIYRYDMAEESYDFVGSTKETVYKCTKLKAAEKYYFAVRAFLESEGLQGEFSDLLETYTKPKKVNDLVVEENRDNSIRLSWSEVAGADGYDIYRALPDEAFVLVGSSDVAAYIDSGLESGRTYRYKVCAYAFEHENDGALSAVTKTTTLPAKPVVKVKGGEKKARITWGAVTGATGYYLYWYDGSEYQYLATLVGKSSTSFIHTNLPNGKSYQYKVEAYRILLEKEYKSEFSAVGKAMVQKQGTTTTSPKLYKTKKKFQDSSAYQNIKDFRKNVKYAKNYVIPGLDGTNVDGFYSSSMCPQGLTFAKSYLILSSYDRKQEENSVLYVIDQSAKKLLLTVALPNKTHAGGVAYDGYNIWVSEAKKVHAIPFSEIEDAIASGVKTVPLEYKVTCQLTHKASTLTYYKNMLWAAAYDELASGYLGAYTIQDKKGTPALEQLALTRTPTKVQGIAFTSSGKMILSRSCQTDASKRGFLHVLDIYKPDLSKMSAGKITIGALKKTVEMPTMNEEIAIKGNYLYVTFESAAFATAVKRMDRVCAFKTTSITD